jgi:hypothetical protein
MILSEFLCDKVSSRLKYNMDNSNLNQVKLILQLFQQWALAYLTCIFYIIRILWAYKILTVVII